MLFHSQVFILGFLPAVLAAYYLSVANRRLREWVLLVASLIFYGWWDVRFLPLLLAQTFATWAAAELHHRSGWRVWLWAGIAVNFASLIFFKYSQFLIDNLAALAGIQLALPTIILPIGISFFTFQLACYLVDILKGDGHHYPWRRVCLFVSLFPHLVAGPIVRHSEIMPQFDADPLRAGLWERIGKGTAFFTVGLLKKVFLADPLATMADPVFAAASTATPSLADAWIGALAFSLQLFLDFSAYSEMAIGIGLMLGVRFPDNFDAPYQALTLQDFWRRWHMTLSRLLRDYVYIPLGGSRGGTMSVVKTTMITMGLCGLWHGAGWTYVVWGLMHGLGLLVARGWKALNRPLPAAVAWTLTMLFVLVGWVLFRAPDFATARSMIAGLVGLSGKAAATALPGPELIIAALAATLGPTTQRFVEDGGLRPRLPEAVLVGLAIMVAVIATGKGQLQSFIYFQF